MPIEPITERYSVQMRKWVREGLERADVNWMEISPWIRPRPIKHGQWLDTTTTIEWKARQIERMSRMFRNGAVLHGDVILLGDAWFPGVESLRFMAEMQGINVRIGGWMYAGCFDPHDLLARSLTDWAPEWERNTVNRVLDFVCVGSEFHQKLLQLGGCWGEFIHATGLAWSARDVERYKVSIEERDNVVVFPHRAGPEKQPEVFVELAKQLKPKFPGWRFVFSTNSYAAKYPKSKYTEVVVHESKADYYRFLARCKVFYSAALQETFGYALHEAIALDLAIAAPNRCAYREFLADSLTYPDTGHIGTPLVARLMKEPVLVSQQRLLLRGVDEAIKVACRR